MELCKIENVKYEINMTTKDELISFNFDNFHYEALLYNNESFKTIIIHKFDTNKELCPFCFRNKYGPCEVLNKKREEILLYLLQHPEVRFKLLHFKR